jgi:hypothetical protein
VQDAGVHLWSFLANMHPNTFGSCWHEDRTLMLSDDGLGWIFKVDITMEPIAFKSCILIFWPGSLHILVIWVDQSQLSCLFVFIKNEHLELTITITVFA